MKSPVLFPVIVAVVLTCDAALLAAQSVQAVPIWVPLGMTILSLVGAIYVGLVLLPDIIHLQKANANLQTWKMQVLSMVQRGILVEALLRKQKGIAEEMFGLFTSMSVCNDSQADERAYGVMQEHVTTLNELRYMALSLGVDGDMIPDRYDGIRNMDVEGIMKKVVGKEKVGMPIVSRVDED